MAVLQAYQADLLKELDEGKWVNAEDIRELHKTDDLSPRATKETARAIGRSMSALVPAERHLWYFLLDAPLTPSGLFGDTVGTVVDRHQESRKQAAVIHYRIQFGSLPPRFNGVNPTLVGPEKALVMELRSIYSLEEGGHRGGPSSQKRVRVLHPVLHGSQKGWRVVSLFRSASVKLLSQQTEVQDAHNLVLSQISSKNWFVTIDLKYAYFISPSFPLTEIYWGLLSGAKLTNIGFFLSA